MLKKQFLITLLFLVFLSVFSQNDNPIRNSKLINIGPSIMSGRVTAIAVNPNKPTEFYVAYASGGLWFTANNGITFTAIMDNSKTQNIGALAVDFKNHIIWVGTGENNSSRSSYAGIGILKSIDNGKTWQNTGLTDSHHIGKIILNPNNKDEVIVGVLGHLYSPNKERGIFKTTDGGKTWQHTLFINEDTGIVDISSVKNSNILYASAWERERKSWNFKGSGKHSAIYKSTDFGESWSNITKEDSGFPNGNGVGRIGVAAFDENTVYAILDNQFRREKKDEKEEKTQLEKDDFKTMSKNIFMALENEKLNNFLKNNGFPKKYDAKSVKKLVKKEKIQVVDIAKFLENANTQLFNTPVKGAEVYRSDDGGKSWQKTHNKYIDGLYYSYGYYFGRIHVDNHHKNKIYIYGVPILKSSDGGKSFTSISKENVHADHHDLWINPYLKGHLINGNDGGINISYDDGENWSKANNPDVGQFYTVNVDQKEPYNVYGGLQDNGVWKGKNTYKKSVSWHQSGKYPYESIMGGDGMQIAIDTKNNIVYTGYQFGNYFRINSKKDEFKYIQPKHNLGESPLRFNWQTPIHLSVHNNAILYLGANKLYRSMKNGDDFKAISEDLTKGGIQGNVPYGTLTTISESSFEFGLIYTGSDDGLVHLTKNSGSSWTNISNNLPSDLWVSRVIASKHKKERVYVTLNGYRNDNFKSYVFVSDNYGEDFIEISNNLPNFPVNVIKEDLKDQNILYLGNDNGVFVSFNKGENWNRLDENMPKVAVHDLVIQNKENDLVIGTHGRSLYKINLNVLQEYNQVKEKDLAILDLKTVSFSNRWGNKRFDFSTVKDPKFEIPIYTKTSRNVALTIKSENNLVLYSRNLVLENGINYNYYNLSISEKVKKKLIKKDKDLKIMKRKNDKYYLPKGKYKVTVDGISKDFEIK
jgi:photosystem II stability/assembly factor-like uncharacterized protein